MVNVTMDQIIAFRNNGDFFAKLLLLETMEIFLLMHLFH